MSLSGRPRVRRVAIAIGSFLMVVAVGYTDWRSSAYIAFSIFYLVPVFLAAWFVNRAAGVAIALACGATGLVADLLSTSTEPVYAYTNFCLRLLLFVCAALVITRLRRAMTREQEVAEREREAAERLAIASQLQAELMRSVARGAWEPLADIHSRVVDLHFDMANVPEARMREVLSEIAEASVRVSALVNTLLEGQGNAHEGELTSAAPADTPASSAV